MGSLIARRAFVPERLTISPKANIHSTEVLAGASRSHIIFKHLLPNQIKSVIVYSGLAMSGGVLVQAALAYLGFTAGGLSWGFDLYMAQQYILSGSWWMTVFLGGAITLTSLGFYLISEGLRKTWR
ncbi:MAG: hypothetical protein QW453_01780 [Thermoprotei archaeon]